MKLVSVIIPAYNEENYLKNTLDSIRSQNYKEIETIVVCNGCTDKTEEIAKKYTNKVTSIKEGNVSKARNIGVKQSQGDFLVFLDADTKIFPEVISKISKQLQKGHYYGTIAGKSEHNKLKLILHTKTKNTVNSFYPWSNGLIFCKKEDFLKTPGFNPNLTYGELRHFYKNIEKTLQI